MSGVDPHFMATLLGRYAWAKKELAASVDSFAKLVTPEYFHQIFRPMLERESEVASVVFFVGGVAGRYALSPRTYYIDTPADGIQPLMVTEFGFGSDAFAFPRWQSIACMIRACDPQLGDIPGVMVERVFGHFQEVRVSRAGVEVEGEMVWEAR